MTSWAVAHQAFLSFTISWNLLKLISIESVMPSNHLILCCPLFFLPSVFPSIRVFSNELALLIRWPKYRSCSFSVSPSNEYSGLTSFWIDWIDLVVQGTLKSLLQHHSSKALSFWCSALFMVQLSHPYMTTGKTIALTIWAFVYKILCNIIILLFSMFLLLLEFACLKAMDLYLVSLIYLNSLEQCLVLIKVNKYSLNKLNIFISKYHEEIWFIGYNQNSFLFNLNIFLKLIQEVHPLPLCEDSYLPIRSP